MNIRERAQAELDRVANVVSDGHLQTEEWQSLALVRLQQLAAIVDGAEVSEAVLWDLPQPPASVAACALYRFFDADRTLLYVGISDHHRTRANEHRQTAAWQRFAVEKRLTWHIDRAAAADAERNAIERELPLFNHAHAAPGRDRRLADYLIRREAWDLLRPDC